MQTLFRPVLISIATATFCALAVSLVVLSAGRPQVLIGMPAAATSTSSTIDPAVITSGDATVSLKPDIALLSVGVDSLQATAAAAQSDLANKAGKLIARAKALGIADKDVSTSGYFVGPNYRQDGAINGYRASEQLQLKWHEVDTTGKALDALVQEGGATQVSVNFGLADPKSAQAEARTMAIADARSRAQAMAGAAGVKLGRVLRVSDLTVSGRMPPTMDFAVGAAPAPSQLPTGQLDVQVTVEVDFAIDG